MTDGVSNATMVAVYNKIREARSALSKEFEAKDVALKEQLKRIEAAMLDLLNKSDSKSIATDNGTFYKQEDILPSGSDWGAFYAWVKENDAFEALDRRIKKTFISQFMDENDGALPPGISVVREWVVRVRRKS